jgi:hypothetical protein
VLLRDEPYYDDDHGGHVCHGAGELKAVVVGICTRKMLVDMQNTATLCIGLTLVYCGRTAGSRKSGRSRRAEDRLHAQLVSISLILACLASRGI